MCKKKEGCMEQYFGLSKEFAFHYLGEQPKPDQPVQILFAQANQGFCCSNLQDHVFNFLKKLNFECTGLPGVL